MILQNTITVYFVLCWISKGMVGKKREKLSKKALFPELNCTICVVD